MPRTAKRTLQGDFLLRHLSSATGLTNQKSIASEVFGTGPEKLSRWINGRNSPEDLSLLIAADYVFKNSNFNDDKETFRGDFLLSFRFLEGSQGGENPAFSEAPELAQEFLYGNGKPTSDLRIKHAPSASPQPRLTPPRQTGLGYHFATRHLEVLGREEEQEYLREFRDAGPGFRWMQLAGDAGQGKSRLAYELIEETGDDWARDFIEDEGLAAFRDHWEHWIPDRPHLIVVDYVIGNEASLKPAIQVLASRRDSFDVAVRLLLVERQAWNDGGPSFSPRQQAGDDLGMSFQSATSSWYAELTEGRDGHDKSLDDARFGGKDGCRKDGVVHLRNLTPDQLLEIVRRLDVAQTICASDDEIKTSLQRIDSEGRPLYAYFLALALIEGGFRPGWKNHDLLTWMLQRDRDRRWKSEFPGRLPDIGDDPPKLEGETDKNPAMRMALLATLIG